MIPSPDLNVFIDLSNVNIMIIFGTYRGCPLNFICCYYTKYLRQLLKKIPISIMKKFKGNIINLCRFIFSIDQIINIYKKIYNVISKIINKYRKFDKSSFTV